MCIGCYGGRNHMEKCPSCSGSGYVDPSGSYSTSYGNSPKKRQCITCNGRGRIQVNCYLCGGAGYQDCTRCGPTTEIFHFRKLISELTSAKDNGLIGEKIISKNKKFTPIAVFSKMRDFNHFTKPDKRLYADSVNISIVYARTYAVSNKNGTVNVPVENGILTYPDKSFARSKSGNILNYIYLIAVVILIILLGIAIYILYNKNYNQ